MSSFKYQSIPLKDIDLDDRNPRIVTQGKLSSQQEILQYLFEHEDLEAFIKKIASEGKNLGAERPYVVKTGTSYTVVEGNTRIAAYKVLTGFLLPPTEFAGSIPHIPATLKKAIQEVDCSIAPNRDALLPIMANAHFGLGDKSKWGYLGSRKAVYDEWKGGKSIPHLAKAFDRTEGQIRELILEYLLYLKALSLTWTIAEKNILLNPAVAFNPPVRFLQTSGHKEKMGISYDNANVNVVFGGTEAEKKFKHLLLKLVINPSRGLGATASYEDVFKDYPTGASGGAAGGGQAPPAAGVGGGSSAGSSNAAPGAAPPPAKLKAGALFSYLPTMNNALVSQLLKESRDINCKRFPAAGTFLLRNVVEAILKHIIDQQKANPASKLLDLEGGIGLCLSKSVSLGADDKKILKEFNKTHLSYLNLGSHGTVIPNYERVTAARDCIDQFVKRNV